MVGIIQGDLDPSANGKIGKRKRLLLHRLDFLLPNRGWVIYVADGIFAWQPKLLYGGLQPFCIVIAVGEFVVIRSGLNEDYRFAL